MTPAGHIVLNNDADLDYVRNKVSAWAVQFDRPDWRYIATYGAEGAAPPGPASSYYPYAGQLVSRSGWNRDAQWSFFDTGPWGIAHQHNDRLHVSLQAGRSDFLVDTGRVNYIKNNPLREHIVSSAAHNVILIDGADQGPQTAERDQPDTDAAVITDSYDFAVGSVAGGFPEAGGTVEHARALFYLRNHYWLVIDRIQTDRPRRLSALWHLHPDRRPQTGNGDSLVTVEEGGANLRITPLGEADWSLQVVAGRREPAYQGWYSPVYNTVVPSPTAVYETEIERTAVFAWLLTTGPHPLLEPAAQVEGIDQDRIRVTVGAGHGLRHTIGVDMGGNARSAGGSLSAARALIEFSPLDGGRR